MDVCLFDHESLLPPLLSVKMRRKGKDLIDLDLPFGLRSALFIFSFITDLEWDTQTQIRHYVFATVTGFAGPLTSCLQVKRLKLVNLP